MHKSDIHQELEVYLGINAEHVCFPKWITGKGTGSPSDICITLLQKEKC